MPEVFWECLSDRVLIMECVGAIFSCRYSTFLTMWAQQATPHKGNAPLKNGQPNSRPACKGCAVGCVSYRIDTDMPAMPTRHGYPSSTWQTPPLRAKQLRRPRRDSAEERVKLSYLIQSRNKNAFYYWKTLG